MEFTLGKEGLDATWQDNFPKTTECVHCQGESRIGFVAHEGMTEEEHLLKVKFVCELHNNEGKGGYWLHDCCAVAVYFCRECLETTALYNQA